MKDVLNFFAKRSNSGACEAFSENTGADILIISDTHGNTQAIKQLVKKYHGLITAVVHLGDHSGDMLRMAGPAVKMDMCHIVSGNTDPAICTYNERVIDVADKRIFITHGHRYNVKAGLDLLIYKARELQVDACLFGHTHHQTLFTQSDIVFLNPGSPSSPHFGTDRGYGLLRISNAGVITGELLTYWEDVCPEE